MSAVTVAGWTLASIWFFVAFVTGGQVGHFRKLATERARLWSFAEKRADKLALQLASAKPARVGAMPEATSCGPGVSRAVQPEEEPHSRPVCWNCAAVVVASGGHWRETNSDIYQPCHGCGVHTLHRIGAARVAS